MVGGGVGCRGGLCRTAWLGKGGACSLGGSCLMVWIPPAPPPHPRPLHTQALRLSGVFRPVIPHLSCALEPPGEL